MRERISRQLDTEKEREGQTKRERESEDDYRASRKIIVSKMPRAKEDIDINKQNTRKTKRKKKNAQE